MYEQYTQDSTDFSNKLKNEQIVDISDKASYDGATEYKQMSYGFRCLIRK
jgi:hypothetical protein